MRKWSAFRAAPPDEIWLTPPLSVSDNIQRILLRLRHCAAPAFSRLADFLPDDCPFGVSIDGHQSVRQVSRGQDSCPFVSLLVPPEMLLIGVGSNSAFRGLSFIASAGSTSTISRCRCLSLAPCPWITKKGRFAGDSLEKRSSRLLAALSEKQVLMHRPNSSKCS